MYGDDLLRSCAIFWQKGKNFYVKNVLCFYIYLRRIKTVFDK